MVDTKAHKKKSFIGSIFSGKKEEGGRPLLDYRVVFAAIVLLLIAVKVFAPAYVDNLPIIGPYLLAIESLYETGAEILAGNIEFWTVPKFLLAFTLVLLPPGLIALGLYILQTATGAVKFMIPIIIILSIGILLYQLVGIY